MAGCSSQRTLQTQIQNKAIQVQPRPSSLNLYEVEFYVVTEDRFSDFKNRFLAKNEAFVFVSFSVRDYENLSKNVAELERYIKEQEALLQYYEKAITSK